MFFFFNKYKRSEERVVEHNGVFKKEINLFQAIALIVTSTVGAGIFGLPYAVSKSGILVGLIYLFLLGVLVVGLNLMLGQVSAQNGFNIQIVGLANKYLGRAGEVVMTMLFYLMSFGVLVIYLIGEGEALSALFGFSKFFWSLVFFVIFGIIISIGLRAIRVIDFVLSLSILAVILIIVWISSPHIDYNNYIYTDLAHVFFPFGVILFSYSSLTSIPEAHSLLINKQRDFKKAIIISGLIVMVTYILFTLTVLGVTGLGTSEIATIALGEKVGKVIYVFGNIFAILAMGTGFLMSGISLKDSLVWDYKFSKKLATVITLLVPLVIFILGIRQFIAVIDIVGGVFVSTQMLLIVLIYWKAKQIGDLNSGGFKLHHVLLLAIPLTLVLIVGAIYSTIKLFY